MKKRIFILMLFTFNLIASDKYTRDDSKEIVFDNDTKLTWQDTIDNKQLRLTWDEANKYCTDLVLNDNDTWRLPSHQELLTIVEDKKYNPSINKVFQNAINGFYWSSTEVKGRTSAWYVRFDYGRDGTINMTSKNYVRCVY
jgi:hypothetical protein